MSVLDAYNIIIVRLVSDLQLVHHRHEDDAVRIRVQSAFLANVVESRRDVLFDRDQLLGGGGIRIDAEFANSGISS